jgi:SAM-dependent methyltransferase
VVERKSVEWDETLYAGCAAFYAVGRIPYPEGVADALKVALGLDGTGRLLDVGCGPGSLTLRLAPLFTSVIGLDADRDMLDEAARQADRAAVENVTWVRMRAEDISDRLGSFRVVTFAQSFHWLDRPRVAQVVRGLLDADGGCVHLHATTHQGVPGDDALPHPRPPRTEIDELVARYLGPVRRAGRRSLPDGLPDGEEEVMRAAGLLGPRRLRVAGGTVVERTEDEVVASVFSLSSAAPHLFGDRRAEFESDLRSLLRIAAPDRRFCERMRDIALDIWRP